MSFAAISHDEDSTLVERAEDRSERFSEYSEHRTAAADRAQKAVASIADGIPFGQPILIRHHSEHHARRDAQKIEDGMRRTVRMTDTSTYWTDCANEQDKDLQKKVAHKLARVCHMTLPPNEGDREDFTGNPTAFNVLREEPSILADKTDAMRDTLRTGIAVVFAPQLFPTPRAARSQDGQTRRRCTRSRGAGAERRNPPFDKLHAFAAALVSGTPEGKPGSGVTISLARRSEADRR